MNIARLKVAGWICAASIISLIVSVFAGDHSSAYNLTEFNLSHYNSNIYNIYLNKNVSNKYRYIRAKLKPDNLYSPLKSYNFALNFQNIEWNSKIGIFSGLLYLQFVVLMVLVERQIAITWRWKFSNQ